MRGKSGEIKSRKILGARFQNYPTLPTLPSKLLGLMGLLICGYMNIFFYSNVLMLKNELQSFDCSSLNLSAQ